MKTRYKGYDIEIDHDVVWGFGFLITDPEGFTTDSDDVVCLEDRGSWRTEKEAFDVACDTVNDLINEDEAKFLTKQSI
jgi:hypothetical protein